MTAPLLEQRIRERMLGADREDEVLTVLRSGETFTKHELYVALSNRIRRAELNRHLLSLEAKGRARMRVEPTAGRPREVWWAV